MCTGDEQRISECSYEGPERDFSCSHYDDLFIFCTCKDMFIITQGVVIIFHHQLGGAVKVMFV